ncbi:MAG: IS110 family transposase [Candidatus Aenigmatarchaeota archaeon]|nr:MAG: IS110 family transposase [Candidatus Aenigmarchaeota archaeon]
MPMTFARLLDPCFEDDDDPFRHYDVRGEPLEDRLYLPCGIDPHKKVCYAAFVHPLPHRQEILTHRRIPNRDLQAALWLVQEGKRLAHQFKATPIYVFETSGPYWRPYRLFLHQLGLPTATVSGRQTKRARGTGTRKTHNDLKAAYLIAKVFKQGESHASRIPPEPIASLREYARLHFFFVKYSVAIQNRMFDIRYQTHPGFDDLLSKPTIPTALALAKEELMHPVRLLQADHDELVQTLRRASRGKLGDQLADALHHSALTAFYAPYAVDALSFNLRMLAEAYDHIHRHILPPLRARMDDCLNRLPFEQYLPEMPYVGPVTTGTFLGELGLPSWFKTVDSVVAWFGFDPSLSESADHETGTSHLTKRGTKYGRRIWWLVARNWSRYVSQGRRMFKKEFYVHGLSYDGAICVIAAKLVRIAFAMVRDGTHFDMSKAFPG